MSFFKEYFDKLDKKDHDNLAILTLKILGGITDKKEDKNEVKKKEEKKTDS